MTAPSIDSRFRHWHLHRDAQGLAWLTCDREGESVNVLSAAVFRELDQILGSLEAELPGGLVVLSGKPGSFILGADIREFDALTSAEEATQVIREGQSVFARLENLGCPTVAAVHGLCLGGGLELALACDQIVAMHTPETRVGLPEVKLGIFPALGGLTRLTERVGGLEGLKFMLTGKMLRTGPARRKGLVDVLVDRHANLRWAARRAVLKGHKKQDAGGAAGLTNRMPARAALARVMRHQTAEKANPEHYPAPCEMIDLWAEHRDNRVRMFEEEAKRAGELMVGSTARNLRRVFFMTERLKALGKGSGKSSANVQHSGAKGDAGNAAPVRRVHVVGAGVMGGDIATWCALQGLEVSLQDRDAGAVESAIDRAGELFSRRLKTRTAQLAARARLLADVAGEAVPRADVVIEAIVENLDAKRALYAELEPMLAPDAVLATNTSALKLEDLASGLNEPGRLIGLHFFNPVARMPLVEVITAQGTDQRLARRGAALCTRINRFPLPVKSSPGFLVNRVLAPYLMEAMTMLVEGIDQHTIDASAIRFGMPMGPIELADVVGLDVCTQVAETLATGDVSRQAELLSTRIQAGKLGKKSGEGFYEWDKGKANRKPAEVDNAYGDELARRLMKPFLDECQAVSREGIVADDELLDAGIIFGTGFAPFRGGPMNYLKETSA